jgi:hypothetical protein
VWPRFLNLKNFTSIIFITFENNSAMWSSSSSDSSSDSDEEMFAADMARRNPGSVISNKCCSKIGHSEFGYYNFYVVPFHGYLGIRLFLFHSITLPLSHSGSPRRYFINLSNLVQKVNDQIHLTICNCGRIFLN